MKSEYLLVSKEILPSYFEQVIKCRELVDGKNVSVSDACKLTNISRSTYYKYKDYVFAAPSNRGQHAIISCRMIDRKGILSTVLNTIFAYHGNIITINQNMPINQIAYISLAVDISDMSIDMKELIQKIKEVEGVKLVELLAVE